MNIALLALDEVLDTGLAILLDTFAFANTLAPSLGQGAPRFDVQVLGMRRRVRTHHGSRLDAAPLNTRDVAYLVLPALFATAPGEIDRLLLRPDVADAVQALSNPGPIPLAAACTSTFVLAASGALDARRATTTWWLAPAFRERFPAVDLDASRMLVDDPGRITAGAAMAHADLALWIVRQASPALASLVARYLVVDARPSQAPFIIPDHLAHADPLVERFERWVRDNLARGASLETAARAIGASQRTLERRVRAVVGKTPVAFVQDIRVEVATHLLRSTDQDLDAVAAQVGYADATTLRTLLRHKLGRGVREIRRPSDLGGQQIDPLDDGGPAEQLAGPGHQGGGDGAFEVGDPGGVGREGVEDAEGRGAEAQGEPVNGPGLGLGERQGGGEEGADLLGVFGAGFQTGEQGVLDHDRDS